MFGWFRKDRAAPAVPASEPAYPAPAAAEMRWRSDATLPIPDWEAMDVAGGGASDAFLHDWYTAAARRWMEALGRALPDGQYSQRASDDFLLLSSLPDRTADLVLERCEQARRAIRQRLGSIGKDEGYGPHVVVVFASQDSYYAYLEHYGPRGDGRALSSGVFLDAGYGHFASWHDGLDELEPVVVHELTHALLRHLDLPVWLNEGLAQNVEHALVPALADPRVRLYTPAQMHARHLAWWDAERIQAFWSGEAFHFGEGVELAYDLAAILSRLAAREDAAFRAFVVATLWEDAGAQAAEQELGFPLANLVTAVLGEGDWEPRPSTWRQPDDLLAGID